jgi:CHASE2 domain-containing sensor protein
VKTSPIAQIVSGRLVLVCGLVAAIVAAALGVYRPAFLARLDYRVYDAMVSRARTDPPTERVVIVDVDERSLSEVGQWPWRRDLVGRLIAGLRQSGAAVIALDVVFAEPDRNERAVGNASTSPDAAFADTLRAGHVVIGYAFTFEGTTDRPTRCVLHPLGLATVRPAAASAASPLFRASGVICNVPALAQAAGASGFLNAVPDADGVLRRVPLLIEFDNRVYPALMLAAVLLQTDAPEIALRIGNTNAASLLLGNRLVPLDGKGNLLLNYRGKKNTFRYVSAADVMSGRLAAGVFKDKLVVVGATALGTRDAVTTPLDTLFTGVEVQATVADNLLRQDFISRSGLASIAESLVALALGIAVAFLIARTGPTWGVLVVIGCWVGLWAGAEWALSVKRTFLSPLIPMLGCVAQLAAMTLASFTRERGRADRASVERAVAQRLMIQSLLSLAEMRDADTGSHSRRTQHYAKRLAEQLAAHPRFRDYLTPERIDLLASLAPLHDIGKVGIPDQLLNKPGQLTRDEIEEMRRHPSYGRDVIVRAEQQVGVHDDDVLAMAKDIVYTHHEWWDGHGYPRGLRGEQIPIPGRVVMLVDVYDALRSRRVYRQPLLHASAVDVIVDGRGTHFDPAVVDAFMQVASEFQYMSEANLFVDAEPAEL